MKKIYIILSIVILVLFIIVFPTVSYDFEHIKYLEKLGIFNVNLRIEKTFEKIDSNDIEIYKVDFKDKENFNNLILELNKIKDIISYDEKSFYDNNFFQKLILNEKVTQILNGNEIDKVYCIYKTLDHKVSADIIITFKSDGCYFILNYN